MRITDHWIFVVLVCFCGALSKIKLVGHYFDSNSVTVGEQQSFWMLRNKTSYPGRFRQFAYPNKTVAVQFHANPRAEPYNTTCAPGLTCLFSDKSWHEVQWKSIISFPESSKRPNTILASIESPGHPSHPDLIGRKNHAGLATADLNSDVPLGYLESLPSIFQPKSDAIKIWRILHIAGNCGNVQSNRNSLVETLIKRGLVDSFGKCHHNKDWNNTHQYPPKSKSKEQGSIVVKGAAEKYYLSRQYAFVTALENSYYPGYITEKLWEPLKAGSLPIYLGAPNAKILLPENSFIDVNDFVSYHDLADFIEFLIRNRDAYEYYHVWRKLNISKDLEETYKFLGSSEWSQDQSMNCRLCRWGAENL